MTCDYKKILDLARDGQWDAAHELVQVHSDPQSCLIHGYLHRLENDLGNASYWYRRADQEIPNNSLDEELKRLYTLTVSN